jgi:putative nucleotidyltransferase with HDIG domain
VRPTPFDMVPWAQVQEFLAGLSTLVGLRTAIVPAGSGDEESWTAGLAPACNVIRGNGGERLCRDSHRRIIRDATAAGGPVFDLCHARFGQVAVPVEAPGDRGGPPCAIVCVCGALLHGLSQEHRDHLEALGRHLGLADPRELPRAAGEGESFSRAQLTRLGGFIHTQVMEKVAASGSLEQTTELFLRKYEELMFLYAISENLSPDMEYGRVLSVILDKGMQKLSARSGLFLLVGPEGAGRPEAVTSYGDPLLPEGGAVSPAFAALLFSLSGPVLVEASPDLGFLPQQGSGHTLVFPFRVKSQQTGYLVIAPIPDGCFSEDQIRFVMALASQASGVLHNLHLYRELSDLLFSTLEALSTAIDAKDAYTRGHSTRVAEHAVRTARSMGFAGKALTRLKLAGLLHDFGKVVVSQQILKKGSSLSLGERDDMQRHSAVGAQILGKFKAFAEIVPAVRHHHERWDGQGYPDRLRGEEIPLPGRILAVADAFDAMVTSRPYRARIEPAAAFAELRKNAGTQFDPRVVEAFGAAFAEAQAGAASPEPERRAGNDGQG